MPRTVRKVSRVMQVSGRYPMKADVSADLREDEAQKNSSIDFLIKPEGQIGCH